MARDSDLAGGRRPPCAGAGPVDAARRLQRPSSELDLDRWLARLLPIIDPQGHFLAALAFHGPSQRIQLDHARANCRS